MLTRERLIHRLYEAAELEHNLMCTYLYAAFSLKEGEAEGLTAEEAAAVRGWRRTILDIAIEEMGHLVAVWNITAAVGGAPRFGRTNFPLDPGYLPAGIVVKLAPFSEAVLQHFIHLERPLGSSEPDGDGFERTEFTRAVTAPRLTPMAIDYDTVGEFYQSLQAALTAMTEGLGEAQLFCGDPALQLSSREIDLAGAQPVRCLKTAIAACDAIVRQGEGAQAENPDSHYCRFLAIRNELTALSARNPVFAPAHPAATNPVLRRPPRPQGRVWIEDAGAGAIVDLANASYQTMLRLMAYAYAVPGPSAEKALGVDLGIDLMKVMALLGESAARRPSGSVSACNAGVSFTALRDSGQFPRGASTRRFFVERLAELAQGASALDRSDARVTRARAQLDAIAAHGRQFEAMTTQPAAPAASASSDAASPAAGPPSQAVEGIETVDGGKITVQFNTKLCIHSRFCVTGAPRVFLANVKGPWIHPDAMDVEELAAVARECPSGAIQYRRNDGAAGERVPPVNLVSTREAGPYAFRGDLRLDGKSIGFRATLCRCGASKNKPFCDGSHHEMKFTATGEPQAGRQTDMLAVRDGPVDIAPQLDGPLQVRGNVEVISGTGRVVARLQAATFCRCGHSGSKPFCDGTHAKIGFRSG